MMHIHCEVPVCIENVSFGYVEAEYPAFGVHRTLT